MQIAIDPQWALTVFFVAVRIGTVLVLSPVFTSLNGLITLRVLLTLALSVLLVSGMDLAPAPAAPPDLGQIVLGALGEVGLGLVLAFGVFAAFGAFAVAGKILDIQTGFGIGNVYDPVTRSGAAPFATMLKMVALVVFFSMDGHHALLRGLAFSLRQVEPGMALAEYAAAPVIRQFGLMFSLGVALIVPVMFCLLLAEVALAVVSRVLPQMNIFVIGVPVKMVAGLAVLALTVGAAAPSMGRVYASIFTYWEQVLS